MILEMDYIEKNPMNSVGIWYHFSSTLPKYPQKISEQSVANCLKIYSRMIKSDKKAFLERIWQFDIRYDLSRKVSNEFS